MDPNKKIKEKIGGVPVDTTQYQKIMGKLIYLSPTQSNIVSIISVVSQFMHHHLKNT